MNIPTKSNNSNIRLAYEEKLKEREAWQKLVVKVITWKDGSVNGAAKLKGKISSKEWSDYCQKMVKTNVTYGKIKVLENLNRIWSTIHKNGGFEEK